MIFGILLSTMIKCDRHTCQNFKDGNCTADNIDIQMTRTGRIVISACKTFKKQIKVYLKDTLPPLPEIHIITMKQKDKTVLETIKRFECKYGDHDVYIQQVEEELSSKLTKNQVNQAIERLMRQGELFMPRPKYVRHVIIC